MDVVKNTDEPFCKYCCLQTGEPLIEPCRCRGNDKSHFSCLRHKIIRSADAKCQKCRTNFADSRIKRYRKISIGMAADKHDDRLRNYIAVLSALWLCYHLYSMAVFKEAIAEVKLLTQDKTRHQQIVCSADPKRRCPQCLEAYHRIVAKNLNSKDLCDVCRASYEAIVRPAYCPLCPKPRKRSIVCRKCSKKLSDSVICFCGQCGEKSNALCDQCSRQSSSVVQRVAKTNRTIFSRIYRFVKPFIILGMSLAILKFLTKNSRFGNQEKLSDFKQIHMGSGVDGNGKQFRQLRLFVGDAQVFVQQIGEPLSQVLRDHNINRMRPQ